MENIRVSVVMPFYNSALYIRETLEQVRNQTVKDIEIICVSDGSTDESVQIVKDVMQEDARVQLYEQENQSAGAARNNGFSHVQGEYTVFWDSDDHFLPNALEIMLQRMEETGADMCVCGADEFNEKDVSRSEAFLNQKVLPDQPVFSKRDIPESIFDFATNVPWNKMFRTSFIRENQLSFQDIKQANDTYFSMTALYSAQKITCVTDHLIQYRVENAMSITGKSSKNPLCIYEAYAQTYRWLKEKPDYPELERGFLNKTLGLMFRMLNLQTNFQSYSYAYDFLRQEGFAYFGFQEKTSDYYDQQWMWNEMQMILEMDAGDFLVFKNVQRKRSTERLNRKVRKLEQKNEKQREKLDAMKHSIQYRIGESIITPVRLITGRRRS